jgi:hypothetical protein
VNDIAAEYVEASRQNLHKFQPPRIFFVFCDGITESISHALKGSGIEVVGQVFPDESTEQAPSLHHVVSLLSGKEDDGSISVAGGGGSVAGMSSPEVKADCECINLDVSSMLAWVSALTHGGDKYTFEEAVLNEQAEQERVAPVWPQLQEATKGKRLVACCSAVDSFSSIVETVGGEQEKTRAKYVQCICCMVIMDSMPA